MATPRSSKHLVLSEEGVRALNALMSKLVGESGAKAALLIDKSGQSITAQGDISGMDTMSVAALIMGSFNSTRAIATMLGEAEFKKMFQQGLNQSIYMVGMGSQDILALIFPNAVTVGRIKYKVEQAYDALDAQMQAMYQSSPVSSPIRSAQPPAPKINDLF